MKAKQKLALAVLAGVSIGSAGAQVAHWYPVKTRPMYAFVGAGVTDLASGSPCWCRSEEHRATRENPHENSATGSDRLT